LAARADDLVAHPILLLVRITAGKDSCGEMEWHDPRRDSQYLRATPQKKMAHTSWDV
jgi:hypothetical protein